jgi:hypothetical protein
VEERGQTLRKEGRIPNFSLGDVSEKLKLGIVGAETEHLYLFTAVISRVLPLQALPHCLFV